MTTALNPQINADERSNPLSVVLVAGYKDGSFKNAFDLSAFICGSKAFCPHHSHDQG
jgi:hypothetical protein